MKRRVFFSFHYQADNWRASQVRNAGVVEGNAPVADNDWESITGGGDAAIKKWINEQMSGRSCAVVLVGAKTAGRKWINYEIERAWNEGKGLVGIFIHNLKDNEGQKTPRGSNPFLAFKIGQTPMSSIVPCHEPPYTDSKLAYDHIKTHLDEWVAQAIEIRGNYAP